VNKAIIGVIIIVGLISVAVFLTVGGSLLSTGGNNVVITGTSYYNPITGWGITFNNYRVEESSLLDSLPFGLIDWPWNTGDILVIAKMGVYEDSVWMGEINSWIGGQQQFSVKIKGILETGTMSGTLYLYEVRDRDILGGGGNRVLKAQTNFEVII